MKKLIALITACALMLTMCTGVFAASFPDLEASSWDWARETVYELADKGIVKGYSDGTYQPSNSITKQEAFTLFARIVGVNDEANNEAVEAAQSLYSSVAAKYNTYATKELCYLLYRNILSENELDTYLSESTKNEPMLRHEAAVLITKIMGGESEVQNTVMYVFDFTDADEIPAASKGYIDFVVKKGILRGMENNVFSPNTSVTRAQVAIMLKKTMDTMSLNVTSGEISNINTSTKSFTFNSQTYTASDVTVVNLDGKPSSFSALNNGYTASVTTDYRGVWVIDAKTVVPADETETIEAIFSSSLTDTRGTFIKAYKRGEGASSIKDYPLGSSVKYTYNGAASTISSLSKEDRIYITLTNGYVTAVDGESKYTTVSDAYVDETVLDPVPSLKITHSDSRYNGKTYEVFSGVSVMKNKKTSSLRNILPGDRVTFKLEYDTIISIEATSQLSTKEGTIEEITIGKTSSSVKVASSSGTDSYAIVRDTEILVDGSAATVYDLRVGYTVLINVESDTVTKIDVGSVAQAKSITGTVALVNVSLGFINLNVTDASGSVTTQQVFVKSGASIIGSSTTSRKSLADLVVGDELMVTGEISMGAYEASTIILLEK